MPEMMLPLVTSSAPFAEIAFRLPWFPYCLTVVSACWSAVFQVRNGVSDMTTTMQSALVVAWATSAE